MWTVLNKQRSLYSAWYLPIIYLFLKTISVPARVVHSPRNVTVNESGVAIMTCSGYGNPVPFITWLRYGLLMTNTSRITIIAGLLRIRRVTINDTGIYICNVGNSLKNASSSGYLTVQGWKMNIKFISREYFPFLRKVINISFQCRLQFIE